ncbi:hypothetical protein GALMADRAFT_494543 [Galerina marginata CBS 339.88]|uniref:Uncharacterized protein n=1 Tax=Galerina marginata (strain CBS 339.88) TaxID=685588 RepID=A0A067T005_GALM3|nr:hypothetical protein GALMADRAFT_494543 [Galerina marginata CBS 339.88]
MPRPFADATSSSSRSPDIRDLTLPTSWRTTTFTNRKRIEPFRRVSHALQIGQLSPRHPIFGGLHLIGWVLVRQPDINPLRMLVFQVPIEGRQHNVFKKGHAKSGICISSSHGPQSRVSGARTVAQRRAFTRMSLKWIGCQRR